MRDMLKHGRKFERMGPKKSGVFVRKIPRSKDEPVHLALEINPLDEDRYPTKKIGVIIRNQSELDSSEQHSQRRTWTKYYR
ncbi:MAG: hypothetical protein KGY80_00045 [Candidatus Thorarchaeota archaeon]|nr:hypothetical protein [Candidatus Thorarchaeota archaeon]